ncbi:MAG: hypothetical protein VX463_02090 [Pseudomonadota bacterium]|nr:hypothetical protein [Pseudomonadota bacterium]
MAAALMLVLAAVPSGAPAQQNFSCTYGDRGACLGYGETVCSSSGKCVGENAVCFDRLQCGYDGFTCTSNLTECAEKHDALVRKYNALAGDYNEIIEKKSDHPRVS